MSPGTPATCWQNVCSTGGRGRDVREELTGLRVGLRAGQPRGDEGAGVGERVLGRGAPRLGVGGSAAQLTAPSVGAIAGRRLSELRLDLLAQAAACHRFEPAAALHLLQSWDQRPEAVRIAPRGVFLGDDRLELGEELRLGLIPHPRRGAQGADRLGPVVRPAPLLAGVEHVPELGLQSVELGDGALVVLGEPRAVGGEDGALELRLGLPARRASLAPLDEQELLEDRVAVDVDRLDLAGDDRLRQPLCGADLEIHVVAGEGRRGRGEQEDVALVDRGLQGGVEVRPGAHLLVVLPDLGAHLSLEKKEQFGDRGVARLGAPSVAEEDLDGHGDGL
jgi:hypothetical protein